MPGTATLATRNGHAGDPKAVDARIARSGGQPILVVHLRDQRVLALPLWLYPTLWAAPPRHQRNLELIAGGRGVRWPELDVDLSVRGMLAGRPDVTRAARATARALSLKDYLRVLGSRTPTRRAG